MEARKLADDFDPLKNAKAFNSFSVNNIEEAKQFYGDVLGLDVKDGDMGTLNIHLNENEIFIYPKEDHIPATYTVLNFMVPDVENAVHQLRGKGIRFEQYGGELQTDESGIHRKDGHTMAWFKDPAGNILSLMGIDRLGEVM
jgi:catechol 2,3-dioxygenase-like lactoylglutathione lyase family enzyme